MRALHAVTGILTKNYTSENFANLTEVAKPESNLGLLYVPIETKYNQTKV